MSALLEIRDLQVTVGGREVLKGVNLTIGQGEIHILFGPNGSGKTTLLNSIIGFSNYKVTGGAIIFKGQDITWATIDERARLGIGISFQRPPVISGVRLRSLTASSNPGLGEDKIEETAEMLNAGQFLDREINAGFSGGEIKRTEMLQIILQDPDLVCLDEPESGVDLDNMSLIGQATRLALGRHPKGLRCSRSLDWGEPKAGLVITHTGQIMEYIDVDQGHVFIDGQIVCSGNARDILADIRRHGYSECLRHAVDCAACLGGDRQ